MIARLLLTQKGSAAHEDITAQYEKPNFSSRTEKRLIVTKVSPSIGQRRRENTVCSEVLYFYFLN